MEKREKVMNKNKNENAIGIGKFWAWNSRAISVAAWLMIISYLNIYCTDILHLSPGILGVLLMASKLFDGVTDMIAGFLVDRTKTPLGKGRPYELAIVGLWLCTMFMFSTPTNWSEIAKYVWVLTMYILSNAVFHTFLNASNTVYMVRAFNNQQKYVKLSSLGGIVTTAGAMIVSVTMPMIIAQIGYEAEPWKRMIAAYSIPLMIIGLMRFVFIKEEHDVVAVDENGEEQKVDFTSLKLLLRQNKYIYPMLLASLLLNFIANMGGASYYYSYVFGNIGIMSLTGILSVVCLPLMAFFPKILKRMSLSNFIACGSLITVVGVLGIGFAGKNVVLLVIANIIYGLGNLMAQMMLALMIVDCAEYNEYKGMPRMEGVMNSIYGLAGKIGSAVGTGVFGILLSIAGYDATKEVTNSVLNMIRFGYIYLPAILFLIIAITMHSNKLGDSIEEIRKVNKERRNELHNKSSN
ncbi:MAG: MFS transporter [Eubacteriales bacterium]|nr:MFS transporter [Eubacteriales bacterium]